MSAINPIQGPSPLIPSRGAIGAPKQGGSTGKTDFAEKLQHYIDKVDATQQSSAGSIENLISGNGDIISTVAAVAKADMSFKLLIGVRNKVIEAYKQTMNMQI